MRLMFFLLAIAVALSGALVLAAPALAEPGRAEIAAAHRGLLVTLDSRGRLSSQREWPEVDTPRKFSLELVVDLPEGTVQLVLFVLDDRGGDWWLSEVMGFLFDPIATVSSFVSHNGYEGYYVDLPGGRGVPPQREALLLTELAAIRVTCIECAQRGMEAEVSALLDSLAVTPIGAPYASGAAP